MKVVLLCKSDAVGGAAVVTFRLMNALRKRGIDARMLVAQKSTASPYVDEAAHGLRRMMPFLSERLRIYIDKSSIEVFGNGGQFVMTNLVFPVEPYSTLSVSTTGGKAKVSNLKVYSLKN